MHNKTILWKLLLVIIAHGLEPMNKIRGFQIYNNKMLPKLMDGSLGIYDEISFENNRERLIDFMDVEFPKEYNPSPFWNE